MIRRLAKGATGPLEDMRGSSASLVSDGEHEGDGQELASITEAVGCLKALIVDTDRYAQLDGAAAEPRLAAVDVLSLLHKAAAQIRPLMGGQADVLVQDEAGGAGRVETDGDLLVEAIVYASRHLVAGKQGSSLALHAERMPAGSVEHLLVDVALESAEDLAAPAVTIFDSQALKRPSSGQRGGYGLCLALADRICALLGGSLLAAGRPAESARFRIVVPIAGNGSDIPQRLSA
jgi:K+-sensing histidine kinase KdpD